MFKGKYACLLMFCLLSCDSQEPESISQPLTVEPPATDVFLVYENPTLIALDAEDAFQVPLRCQADSDFPNLTKSTIRPDAMDVDANLERIVLIFDEAILVSDIRIYDKEYKSMNWRRVIQNNRVFLINFQGRPLKKEHQYFIFGSVEDVDGNQRAILFRFLTHITPIAPL